MNKYRVYFQITGCVDVGADNQEEAQKNAEDIVKMTGEPADIWDDWVYSGTIEPISI